MRQKTLIGAALLLVLLSAAACGVKNDLQTPDGQRTPHGQYDPSKPLPSTTDQ